MNKDTACKWSKRSGKREIVQNHQFQLNSFTPGPQHYDTISTNKIESDNDEMRPLQTAPRFVGWLRTVFQTGHNRKTTFY